MSFSTAFFPMHGTECRLAIYIAIKCNEFLSFCPSSYIFLYLQNSPALKIHKNETLVEPFSLKTPIYFAMYLSSELWGYIYAYFRELLEHTNASLNN